MTAPQPGILLDPTAAPLFLVLAAGESDEDLATVRRCAAALPGWASDIDAEHEGDGSPVCTVALGANLLDRVKKKGARPKKLRPFETVRGSQAEALATGGDLFVHVHSDRRDLATLVLLRLVEELDGAAEIVEEVPGFRFLDSRDLTGFVQGTENPPPEDRAAAAILDDDAKHAGGSFVHVQRYVHNLRYWSRLSTEEQEGAIGRTRADNQELAADVLPATAHISRVAIEEDGQELKIVRHGSPYASAGEQGLYFVAYCASPETFDKMLARMCGTSGDGLSDRLMDFTRTVSGARFFAPSVEDLAALAP